MILTVYNDLFLIGTVSYLYTTTLGVHDVVITRFSQCESEDISLIVGICDFVTVVMICNMCLISMHVDFACAHLHDV